MDPGETAMALDELVAEGIYGHIGVSNLSVSRINLLSSKLGNPIVTNQIEFSPLHLNPRSDGTFDAAILAGYRPMLWAPIGGGSLLTSNDERIANIRLELSRIAKKIRARRRG